MGALFFEKERVSGKSGDGFCYKEKTAWTIIRFKPVQEMVRFRYQDSLHRDLG